VARPGQIEFISDLLAKLGLTREDLPEWWRQYEALPQEEASALIDWLKDPVVH
jgi:hypothetical protein